MAGAPSSFTAGRLLVGGSVEHDLQQHVGAGLDVVGRRCTRRCCATGRRRSARRPSPSGTPGPASARRGRRPTACAASSGRGAARCDSTRSIIAASNSTGSKRASERVDDRRSPRRPRSVVAGARSLALGLAAARLRRCCAGRRVNTAFDGHDVDEVRARRRAGRRSPPGRRRSTPAIERTLVDDRAPRRSQRVVAQAHRRRAGVGRLAGDRHLGPRDALHARDDADRDALVLEDRALLDVQLDVRVRERGRRARESGPA